MPKRCPDPRPIRDWRTWYPEARAVRRRVHEREQSGPSIGRGDRHDQGEHRQGGHHLHHRAEPHARDEEEGEHHAPQHHGRAHVRLGQDEDAGEPGDEEHRADDAAVGRVLVETAGDEVGDEQAERELHELGGLEAELPEPDPSARTHGVHSEAGDEDDEEQPERRHEDDRAQPSQLAVVETHGEAERDHADRHPHALSDEDRPGTAVGRDGDHRRRRPDHHEADDAEQCDVHEQQRRDRDPPAGDLQLPAVGPRALASGSGRPAPCRGARARAGARAEPERAGVITIAPPQPPWHGRAALLGPTPDACANSVAPRNRSGG